MTEEQKRKAIYEFFLAPQPLRYTKAFVIGGLLALIGMLFLLSESYGFGLFLLAVGAAWAVFIPVGVKGIPGQPLNEMQYFSVVKYAAAKARYDARPHLDQMVAWLVEDLQGVEERSSECLNLAETTRDPISIIGPLYFWDGVEGIHSDLVVRRRVEDGFFYSTYRVSVFQFTKTFLGSFQANYSMIKDVTTGEQTDEFFYTDVVGVQTKTEATSYTLKTGEKLEHARTFSLMVSSGDKVSVVIDDAKIIRATKEVVTLGEKAVNNIRAMLRDHKVVRQAV